MKDQDKTKAQLISELEELRQQNAALRESEERYRMLAESIPHPLGHYDANGKLIECNRRWSEYTGQTPEEAQGDGWLKAVHPGDVEQIARAVRDALAGGESYQSEHRLRRASNGAYRWHLARAVPMRDDSGRIVSWFSSCIDIDDQKRAEEAINKARHELENKVKERTDELAIFKKFVESSSQGFGIADLDRRIVYANRALCHLLGEDKAEDLIGRLVSDYYTVEWKQYRRDELVRHLDREGHWEGELPILTRQGRLTPTIHYMFPLRDEDGTVSCRAVMMTDLTERKQIEEALRRSEGRFRNYFDQGLVGMAATSLNKQWLAVNDRTCEMLGYSREELCQKTWTELTYSDDLAKDVEQFERLLAGEIDSYMLDKRFVRKQGDIVYTTILIRAFRKEDGTIDHIVALIEDITARKQAEEALRQSEERYELAIRGAGVGLWDWDIRTGKLYFSPRWKTLFGYDESDVGDSVEDWAKLLHPDERDWMLKYLEDFLAGTSPTVTVEYRLRRKDGSYRWIVAHAVVVRDDQGKAIRVVGSHGDIADRKQAEEALCQSRDELRAIYESVGDGLLVADRETLRIVRANAAICSMLGYSEEELLSMSIPALHPKEALSSLVDPIQTGMARHLPDKGNVPMLRKDGSVFYADITGDIFTYQGRPCSLGLFRDITERRQAQAALERERQTLEHMLQSSDHERSIVAYEIHDGLAQYLTGAIMQLQMSDHLRDETPEEARKAFDAGMAMVRESLNEARRLISGVRPPILDESGVMAAVAHLVYDFRAHKGPKIELQSRVDFDRLAPILENAIYRIVQEGLTNAWKHSKSKKVSVGLVQQGNRVRIEIQDWGIGFDPKTVEEGRFGLEGILERARLLGGSAVIESAPGKGTRIAVELPILLRKEKGE